jgi:hypothetical protein
VSTAPRPAADAAVEVEVEYAGRWYPAEVRHWRPTPDGRRTAHVAIRRGTGVFLDTVPEARVRPAQA